MVVFFSHHPLVSLAGPVLFVGKVIHNIFVSSSSSHMACHRVGVEQLCTSSGKLCATFHNGRDRDALSIQSACSQWKGKDTCACCKALSPPQTVEGQLDRVRHQHCLQHASSSFPVLLLHNPLSRETIRSNMLRLGQKISSVRILILKGGSSLRGAFFSVSLGPGAAVSGMQIEINTG